MICRPRCLAPRAACAPLAAVVLGLLLSPAAALGQSFQPDGEPFLVNTFTDGFQENADVARTSTGFAVVWESEAEFNELIYGQRFDDTGGRIGNEFLVSPAERSQTEAAVASRAGGFVVVWQSSDENNVLGRLYDDQGQGGEPGLVNILYQENDQEFSAIDSDAQGNFVVVYESLKYPTDGDGDAVVGALFPRGSPAEFLVNQTISSDQQAPAVGRQPGGDFLVAWESEDTATKGIWARIFDANGQGGGEFPVNQIQDGPQERPDVGAWPAGYVVAWESDDEEFVGIFARRFDSSGAPLGGQFPVNTIQDGNQRFPAVAVFDSGEFVIVWEDEDLGVAGQAFDANGVKVGNQFDVSVSDKREQKPRIALRDEGFMVAWFGAGAEADDDIFGRTYSVPEPGATACGLAALATLAGVARRRRRRAWTAEHSGSPPCGVAPPVGARGPPDHRGVEGTERGDPVVQKGRSGAANTTEDAPVMFQYLKTLGSSLILLAVFASGAHAETVFVDPGEPGEEARDFDIFVDSGISILILWTDNKTLDWEAGIHFWLTPGVPGNLVYAGSLLDENLEPIPGTELAGRTPGGNDPVPLGVINLAERTVFSGILIASVEADAVDIDWNWAANDRPIVGLPEPSRELLFGSALLGLWMARRRPAPGRRE